MMLKLLLGVAIVVLQRHVVEGGNSQLVCRQIETLFTTLWSESHLSTRSRQIQGAPGKRGVPGSKGQTGARGPPGYVDHERINSRIENLVSAGLSSTATDMYSKFKEQLDAYKSELGRHTAASVARGEIFERRFTRLQESASELTKDIKIIFAIMTKGFCSTGKCFWLEVSPGQNISYEQAADMCASRQGGQMAGIYNREQYNEIVALARPLIPESRNDHWLWLGMKITPSTGVVLLPDGSIAQDLAWRKSYPKTDPAYTYMKLVMHEDTANQDQGVYNYKHTDSFGAVCEI